MSLDNYTGKKIILVTGGASSGKSQWAENIVSQTQLPVIYIATSEEHSADEEWLAKIEKHQLRRPSSWQTLVVPRELSSIITLSKPSNCLLVDSLGIWVANCLEQSQSHWQETTNQFCHQLQQAMGTIVLVAEETGQGIVPAYKSGRIFRDRLGCLTRQIGSLADVVYLVTGGRVLDLTVLGKPLDNVENV